MRHAIPYEVKPVKTCKNYTVKLTESIDSSLAAIDNDSDF